MKRRHFKVIYLTSGIISAFLGGLMVTLVIDMSAGLGLSYSPSALIFVAVFFVNAVLLMRAPYSVRNIDRSWVDTVRATTIALSVYLALVMIFSGFESGGDLTVSILASAVITAIAALTFLIPTFRRKFPAPPRKPS